MVKPASLKKMYLLLTAFLCSCSVATEQHVSTVKPNPDFFSQLRSIGMDKKLHDRLTNDKTEDLSIIYANTRFKFTDKQGAVTERTGYAQLTEREKDIVGTNPMTGADYLEFSEQLVIYPGFVTGASNFTDYVKNNFKNPYNSKSATKIILYYDFTIQADGSLSDIKINVLGGIPDKLTEETLPALKNELTRVINMSAPLWSPAQKNGEPVTLNIGIPYMLEINI